MEAAARRLYDCAANGDIAAFRRLVQEDDQILERLTVPGAGSIISKEINVLHVAASFGHAEFVGTVLSFRPELSTECNEEGFTPLHVASSGGHVEACRVILMADPDAALSKDKDGQIPIHFAAIKGKLDALREILVAHPWCVKERTTKGENILHLSVKYNRLETVMFLLGHEEVREMVNDGDGNGNTVLHLAAARKQKEMVDTLLNSGLPVDRNAVNGFGINPYQLFCRRWSPYENGEIGNRMRPIPLPVETAPDQLIAASAVEDLWMEQSENVMLVAILIATVTFQAGIAPPGGVWQDSGTNTAGPSYYTVAPASAPVGSHTAGNAILPLGPYDCFMYFDTAAFVTSLVVILLHLVMKTSWVSRKAAVVGWAINMVLAVVGWAINMVLAVVFLAAAFYYGIAATQPKGSAASGRYPLYLVAWLCGSVTGPVFAFLTMKMVSACITRSR